MKLTLALIIKDESKVLARCLDSVAGIVDEIIVVDTGSIDGSKDIAHRYNARVFDYKWSNHFAEARNFSLQQSTGDWNLILDADEILEEESKIALREFIKGNNRVVGKINIVNKFEQNGTVAHLKAQVTRLIPQGVFFEGRVHEQVVTTYPRVMTDIKVYHDGYYQKDKSPRNLELLRLAISEKENDPYLSYQLARQYQLMKDFDKSISYYIRAYALTPGDASYRPGMVVDYMQTLLSSKRYNETLDLILREQKRYSDYPDFRFFCGVFYMELVFFNTAKYMPYFKQIELEYLACLKIGEKNQYSGVIGTGSFMAAYNLGVFYETTGAIANAMNYYNLSAQHNYQPAIERLAKLK